MGRSMWAYLPFIWINNRDEIDDGQPIASGITHNAAQTPFVIPLKNTWRLTNGQPITAEDVVYDYRLQAASAPKPPFPYGFAGEGGMPNL